MKLLELQRRMLADVMSSGGAADYVKPNDRLTSRERLGIYRDQYRIRLLDSLLDDFPGLRKIVGARKFEKLAKAYLDAHPSRSFTLRDLGRDLPQWLRGNPEFAGDRFGIAIEMARLEWAHIESFDAAEKKPLYKNDIAGKIELQPHIRLLTLHYPVDELRLDAQRKLRSRDTERSLFHLATHRADGSVYYRRLETGEHRILGRFKKGATLATVLRGVSEQDIQEWFTNWARLGWLCRADL